MSGGALVAWLGGGRGLRGRARAWWLAVPLLWLVGLVCLLGPGHLFPKHPFQGPALVRLSTHHALTALDLPGLVCAGAAIALAVPALRRRLTER